VLPQAETPCGRTRPLAHKVGDADGEALLADKVNRAERRGGPVEAPVPDMSEQVDAAVERSVRVGV
jgi:hypothetical protein